MNPDCALSIEHLEVSYHHDPVLQVRDLCLPASQRIAILGPNGAGKSTLIKAVLGLIPACADGVRFLGQPLRQMRRRIAYVPQRSEIDWDYPITVAETVLMGRYAHLRLLQRISHEDRRIARDAMEKLGIADLANRHISALSGGQQQRCFLARAIAQQADIYLFDEPFAGVDIKTEKAIAKLFEQLSKEGKTIISVHHDLNTVESYFDYAVLLNRRLLASGPLHQTLTNHHLAQAFGGIVLKRLN